jgi:hypothetical protein
LRVVGALAGTLLFGVLFGLAVFHSVLVQGQLQLDRMDRDIQAEQDQQRELRLRVGQLVAPERILQEAQARGMVQLDDREYLAAVVPGTAVPPPVTTRASTRTAASKSSTTPPAATTTVPRRSTPPGTNGAAGR